MEDIPRTFFTEQILQVCNQPSNGSKMLSGQSIVKNDLYGRLILKNHINKVFLKDKIQKPKL